MMFQCSFSKCRRSQYAKMSQLMRLWHFSAFVNLVFKRACVAIQWGYFHTSCVPTAKALARLRKCAGLPEPWLIAYVISTIISWAGTNGPRQANLVLIAYASSEGSGEPAHPRSQAVSKEEPSDRKPDPWPLWMAGHAPLKFVMTECSKTQIRLTRSR